MDGNYIKQFLLEKDCDDLVTTYRTNVPNAIHMGGVWEHQIRSIRNFLSFLLFHHGSQLDDESLHTFIHEAAAIINSLPLSIQNTNDPMSLDPLMPIHLLTMKF